MRVAAAFQPRRAAPRARCGRTAWLDALERDRVHVPGVAGDVGDALDAAVVRRVEAVVHARGDAQRHVTCRRGRRRRGRVVAEQLGQRVGESPWPGRPACPATWPHAPTIASHGLASTSGSGSIGRAPGFSSRMKHSCRLSKSLLARLVQVAGRRSERQTAMRRRRAASGCSILLNQPMKRVERLARHAVGEQEVEGLCARRGNGACVVNRGPRMRASASRFFSYGLGAGTAAALGLPGAQGAPRAVARQAPVARRPCADGAPRRRAGSGLRITTRSVSSAPTARRAEVAARRRAAFARLVGALPASASRRRSRSPRRREESLSDLQFTAAYRVPFQFSALRARAPAGRRLPASGARA